MGLEVDFNFSNNSKLQIGSVLISEPFLDDDYFTRSVILLCEHNKEGSFGFVLNKYVDSEVGDIFPEFTDHDIKISVGGPVDHSNLFYIHTLGNVIDKSILIKDEIYLGGDFEQIKELIKNDPNKVKQFKFFIGYSGWGEQQLENELKEKSWLVINNVSTETIIDTSIENIWEDILNKLGGRFKLMSKFPINPSDN